MSNESSEIQIVPANKKEFVEMKPPENMNLEEATKFFHENIERVIMYKKIRNDPTDDWGMFGDSFAFGFIVRGDPKLFDTKQKVENNFKKTLSDDKYDDIFGNMDLDLGLLELKDGRNMFIAGSNYAIPSWSKARVDYYKAFEKADNLQNETYFQAIVSVLKDLVEGGENIERLGLISKGENLSREVEVYEGMIKSLSDKINNPGYNKEEIEKTIDLYNTRIESFSSKINEIRELNGHNLHLALENKSV